MMMYVYHCTSKTNNAFERATLPFGYYAVDRLRAIDWKSRKTYADPSSASLDRWGWGIIPSTLRPSLSTPAMFSSEPLGFASALRSPVSVAYRYVTRSSRFDVASVAASQK